MNQLEAFKESSAARQVEAFDSCEGLPMRVDKNEPTILVVDDDASVQSVLVEALTEGGFPSKVASTGEEAIIQLNAGSFRALIIDVGFGSNN